MVAFFTDIADYKPCVRLPSSICVPGRSRPLATASPRAGNPSAPCCGRAPEPSAAVSSTTDLLDATPQSAESLAPPGGNHKANTHTTRALLRLERTMNLFGGREGEGGGGRGRGDGGEGWEVRRGEGRGGGGKGQ